MRHHGAAQDGNPSKPVGAAPWAVPGATPMNLRCNAHGILDATLCTYFCVAHRPPC